MVARRSDARRNEEVLLRAATAAVHRDGLQVPLGTIAEDAGVGVATLYRHFPTRDDLLRRLTQLSFERVLDNARDAERLAESPTDALRRFVEAAIAQRNELVLPLHGGPPVTAAETIAVRAEVHVVIDRILAQGRRDGSLRDGLSAVDVVVFGALLAQPREPDDWWDEVCRRMLTHYLDGLAAPAPPPAAEAGGRKR